MSRVLCVVSATDAYHHRQPPATHSIFVRLSKLFNLPATRVCGFTGVVTYGQAMGGWGKLSVISTVLHLDNLPVPFLSVETIALDGLFARGERSREEARTTASQKGNELADVERDVATVPKARVVLAMGIFRFGSSVRTNVFPVSNGFKPRRRYLVDLRYPHCSPR